MKNRRWSIPFLTCLCGAAAITAYTAFWPAPAAEPPLGKEAGRELITAAAEIAPEPEPLLEQQPPEPLPEAGPPPFAEQEKPPEAVLEEKAEPPEESDAEPVPALDPRIVEILTAEPEPEPAPEPESKPEPQSVTTVSSGGIAAKANLSQLPETGSYWYDEQASQELMRYINELRISLGIEAMIMDDVLSYGARIRNVEQRGREISHTRPDGRSCFSVLTEDLRITGHRGVGENLVWRTHGAGTAVNAYDLYMQWVNSPGHYDLMVNPDFTHFGVNVLTGPYDSYAWQSYATALFYR